MPMTRTTEPPETAIVAAPMCKPQLFVCGQPGQTIPREGALDDPLRDNIR